MNDPQTIFDTVARGLILQGRPSIQPRTTACAYRGARGARCAAGLLISDENYRKEIEGICVHDLMIQEDPSVRHLRDVEDLVADLQEAHDLATTDDFDSQKINPLRRFMRALLPRLIDVAHKHGLSSAAVES